MCQSISCRTRRLRSQVPAGFAVDVVCSIALVVMVKLRWHQSSSKLW